MATFQVVIAIDGSPSASGALATAMVFPWPSGCTGTGLAVRAGGFIPPYAHAWSLEGDTMERAATSARRKLAARWKKADVFVVDGDPAEAILRQAARVRARAIVVGWRGHGRFRRLLMGSVSRQVVRRTTVPVLVVRQAVRAVRRVVIGVDGSPQAARAVRFLARCRPSRGTSATLVTVVTPFVASDHVLLPPAVSRQIHVDVAVQNAKLRTQAVKRLEKAADQLEEAGWRVRSLVVEGAPLYELLKIVAEVRADALLVGVRGRSALTLGMLGSVTEGVLSRCRAPVLVVP